MSVQPTAELDMDNGTALVNELTPRTAAQIIRERRSRFPAEYSGARLDDALVEHVLESANWAPTHKLTEPWRFVVFCDDALPHLFNKLVEIYRATTPVEQQLQVKIDKLMSMPKKVSHVIAIIMKRDDAKRVPEIEEISSVACAVQNIHLALDDFPHAGGYWSTGNSVFSPQMAEWLGLGPDDKCMGYFYLGEVPPADRTGRRGPMANKVTWKRN